MSGHLNMNKFKLLSLNVEVQVFLMFSSVMLRKSEHLRPIYC